MLPDLSAGAGQQGGRIRARDEDIRGSELSSRSGPGKAGKRAARVDGVRDGRQRCAGPSDRLYDRVSLVVLAPWGPPEAAGAVPGVAGDDENGAAAARGESGGTRNPMRAERCFIPGVESCCNAIEPRWERTR